MKELRILHGTHGTVEKNRQTFVDNLRGIWYPIVPRKSNIDLRHCREGAPKREPKQHRQLYSICREHTTKTQCRPFCIMLRTIKAFMRGEHWHATCGIPFRALTFSLGLSDEAARTRRCSSSNPIKPSVRLHTKAGLMKEKKHS